MIRVSIVGSGGVAEAFALALAESAHPNFTLLEVVGRNEVRRSQISALTNSRASSFEAMQPADIYIIAVSDGAVEEVARMIHNLYPEALTLHTAGAVPRGELGGVIYPMQTFTAGRRVDFRAVPLFVEGEDERIVELANALSDSVMELLSERRKALHLAAVFACNFTNAMFTATEELLAKEDLPLSLYRSLVEETVAKAFEPASSPRESQTGAARRGDTATQKRHEAMLEGDLRDIYQIISRYIWETSRRI